MSAVAPPCRGAMWRRPYRLFRLPLVSYDAAIFRMCSYMLVYF